MKAVIFLTDGFEETEALATADILRRGGVETRLVSLTGELTVTGSHGIAVVADELFTEPEADMLILPGGPGAAEFISHRELTEALIRQHRDGKYLAAICAAPVTLGKLGLLEGRAAVCYPGMEDGLTGASLGEGPVVTDGNIITAKGPGSALAFGLALVGVLAGAEVMEKVRADMTL